jgi:hypothetical protein
MVQIMIFGIVTPCSLVLVKYTTCTFMVIYAEYFHPEVGGSFIIKLAKSRVRFPITSLDFSTDLILPGF